MNRMNDRQRRDYIKRATTVLLFTCLLTGATVYGHPGEAHESKNSEEASVASVQLEKSLMHETSTQGKIGFQPEKQLSTFKKADAGQEVVAASIEEPVEGKQVEEVQQVATMKEAKPQEVQAEAKADSKSPEGFVYNANIPMPKEHQEYLYKLCLERGLDYQKALAVVKHESGFNPNEISETNDYGYFQVNIINHKDLVRQLHTPNKPLDPMINLNWGTSKLSYLYNYWKEKGLTGEQLDTYVWSSYNRGIKGFQENGIAVDYVKKVRTALDDIQATL